MEAPEGVGKIEGLAQAALPRLMRIPASRLTLFAVGAALTVTGLVFLTGGPASPFHFLYLPIVMLPALVADRRIGLVLTAANSALYTLLAVLMVRGVLPPFDGGKVIEPPGGLALQIVGLSSAMVLVTILTSYLTRNLVHSFSLVAQGQRNLTELTNQQATLINQIPEGVITLDRERDITSINQAASTLFKIAPGGRPPSLDALFATVTDRIKRDALLRGEDGTICEIEIDHGGDDIRRAMVRVRAVLSESGERTGTLYAFQDVTKLRTAEEQLAVQEQMARLLADRAPSVENTARQHHFVGESAVMQKVFNLIERVAPSDATVLVHGESGTGKELVARAIHGASPRANRSFVAVNCGAIPENLIESELFGHKKGSFTGADSDNPGLFRTAEGGTIFLDEIGELPLHMQAKLLRAIQEKSVRPVGGTRDIPIDVRIVAATNRNLRREIDEGRFREDLFYRLNVININLPPLRERKDDIPFLVNTVLKRLVDAEKTPVVPPATLQLLLAYDYPGNVRELENLLERAVVLGGEVILPEHIPDAVRAAVASTDKRLSSAADPTATEIIIDDSVQFPVNLDEVLSSIERRYLVSALSQTRGAKKKAAELLGINFRSLRYRLEKFGLGDASPE